MLQSLSTVLNTTWGQFVSIAAGIGVIWGFAKAFGAFKSWIEARIKQREQRTKIPQKTLDMITCMKDTNEQDMRKLNERFNMIQTDIIQLKKDLRTNNDQTATVMLQKMMWSYHFYALKQNKIPLDVRTALIQMAKQYRASGWHNHIPDDFQKKIQECEVE